ncbi:DUF6676 family protein [Corynebacterium sp.]|uniref:Rv1476 family membrane protein n=1 Tax=Corynebacterium sp. TaxID=1720 RepID=UPI0037358734
MSQDNLDLEALAQQLHHDGIAFGTDNLANWGIEESLLNAVNAVTDEGFPQLGVVVVEGADLHGAQLRDLAQDLNLQTGIDTVIVRSPHAVAAVSDTLTRGEIEAGQEAMLAQPDYAAGLEGFASASQGLEISWGVVFVCLLLVTVTVAVFTALFVKR